LLHSGSSSEKAVATSSTSRGSLSDNAYAVNQETGGSAGFTLQDQCSSKLVGTGLASDDIAELSQAEASGVWCEAVLPAVPYNGQLTMPAVTPPATNRQYHVSHSVTAESL